MPPDLHGLYVDCGHFSWRTGQWVREPYAEFTCRHGCALYASGADQVTRMCRAVWTWHAANCPARAPDRPRTKGDPTR